jgi:hypothetical protein
MSVIDGSNVDAANTNAAYISRRAATSSSASLITLNNTDPSSGTEIPNIQAAINTSRIITRTIANVVNGAVLAIEQSEGHNIYHVSGDGSAVTLSSTPFGASYAGIDGTIVVLKGLDDTNTVLILHSDTTKGCILNGSALLKKHDTITLRWNETSDRWEEVSRSF